MSDEESTPVAGPKRFLIGSHEIRGPGPRLCYLGRDMELWDPAEPLRTYMPDLERRLCVAMLELALENLRRDEGKDQG